MSTADGCGEARRGRDDAERSEVEMAVLVRAAQGGDREALSCLVSGERVTLVRFCRRLMGDAVAGEDLAQEALLRAQVSIGRLGPPYRFGAWLLGIAANLAKKAWRAEARRPLSWEGLVAAFPNVEWDESLTAVPSPERRSEVAEEVRLLADAIGALPRWLSDVLVLHYLEGLSYAEVADALELPVSTIKGRLFESRSRLRRSLAACGVREVEGASERKGAETVGRRMAARRSTKQRVERTVMSETRGTGTGTGAKRLGVGEHLRLEVDVDAIAQDAERFITETWPRQKPRATLGELGSPRNRFLSVEVLEYMVLDGVSKQEDVRPFVEWCLAEWGIGEHSDAEVAALTERLRARL